MSKEELTLTIGEFGKRARITVRTLRFYEEIGILVPEKRNNSGHRLYGLEELTKLQQIQSLKFLGYSLQEIKNIIETEMNPFIQLKKSLPMQRSILIEKRNDLNQAIEAIDHVQDLINKEKPITWTVISTLLFQIEHEEDQKEWLKEYFPEDDISDEFISLSKEQRRQLDGDMLDWLASLKRLMKEGYSPQSPEAFDISIKLTEIVTRHIDNKEELAEQLKKGQGLMESSEAGDFEFPNFFTPEEEIFLKEIGQSIAKLYNQKNEEEI